MNLGGTRHQLTAAMDYFKEDGTYDDGSREFTNGSDNFGLALQERMNFGRIGLSLGARFDDFSSEYGTQTTSGDAVSPNINAEIEILTGLSLFGGYSEAVRGSSIIPHPVALHDCGWCNHQQRQPWRSPRSQTPGRQVSSTTHSGLFLDQDHFNASITYFNTRLTNTIEVEEGGRRGAPITAIYNNPDTLTSEGYEISLNWSIDTIQYPFCIFKF